MFKGTSSEASICSSDEKYGLIFTIISLYADVQVKEAVDFMVQIIYSHVLYLHPSGRSKVCVNAVDAEGPQLTLSIIMTSLEKVGGNEQISYESILEDVRRATFRPDRICFLDGDMEPKKVAQHFQVFYLAFIFLPTRV
jgi:hypothetical protein